LFFEVDVLQNKYLLSNLLLLDIYGLNPRRRKSFLIAAVENAQIPVISIKKYNGCF